MIKYQETLFEGLNKDQIQARVQFAIDEYAQKGYRVEIFISPEILRITTYKVK